MFSGMQLLTQVQFSTGKTALNPNGKRTVPMSSLKIRKIPVSLFIIRFKVILTGGEEVLNPNAAGMLKK